MILTARSFWAMITGPSQCGSSTAMAGEPARQEARAASAWAARFPQRYYLEVQRAGLPEDDALVAATVAIAT